MANQRKTGAKTKAKKAAKKATTAARPKAKAARAAKARPAGAKGKATSAARSASAKKHASSAKSSKATAKSPAVVHGKSSRTIGKPAVKGGASAPKLVTRPAPGAKPNIRVVERTPAPNVRPIGVLPPDAVARATHRTPASPQRVIAPARRALESKMDPGPEGITDKDFQEFEQRLIAERQKIMKEMGYLENTVLKVNQRDSSGDLSGYSFHMADVGTDAMEREKAFLFASSEGRLLMEINEALRKVYSGEYGKCEMCERPIARARLEAMPYVRLCVACKERQERENRGGGNAGTP
jgi:DnaK suppressor protein